MAETASPSVEPIYQHTQVGYVTIVVTLLVLVWLFFKAWRSPTYASHLNIGPSLTGYIALIILVTMSLFVSLTIAITPDQISWRFGPGLLRGEVQVKEIAQARSVNNSVLSGFGIRHTSSGTLYNVSGARAIELLLKTGERLRLGTDDSKQFMSALVKVGVRVGGPNTD